MSLAGEDSLGWEIRFWRHAVACAANPGPFQLEQLSISQKRGTPFPIQGWERRSGKGTLLCQDCINVSPSVSYCLAPTCLLSLNPFLSFLNDCLILEYLFKWWFHNTFSLSVEINQKNILVV